MKSDISRNVYSLTGFWFRKDNLRFSKESIPHKLHQTKNIGQTPLCLAIGWQIAPKPRRWYAALAAAKRKPAKRHTGIWRNTGEVVGQCSRFKFIDQRHSLHVLYSKLYVDFNGFHSTWTVEHVKSFKVHRLATLPQGRLGPWWLFPARRCCQVGNVISNKSTGEYSSPKGEHSTKCGDVKFIFPNGGSDSLLGVSSSESETWGGWESRDQMCQRWWSKQDTSSKNTAGDLV